MALAPTGQAEVWTAVRAAAIAAANRGWAVLPGPYLDRPFGLWRGRPAGSAGLCPVTAQWQGTADPDRAEATWTRRPFSVLLECEHGVDVLELPGRLTERAVLALVAADLRCPVTVLLYPARWLLLTATGDGPIPEFQPWPGALYRGAGTWMPLPPTNLGQSRARWHTDPTKGLPEAERVQRIIAASLHGPGVGGIR